MTTPEVPKTKKQFVKDLLERAANTFWQGAIPSLVGFQTIDSWSEAKSIGLAACVGGAGAILSALKSWAASRFGVKNSASLSPKV
ncbi:hypothetical protein ACWIG4_30425 [Streptomyces sp. NPDC002248]